MAFEPAPCDCGGTGGPTDPGGSCAVAAASVLRLCDLGADCAPFLRHIIHNCSGAVSGSTDTTLDGVTPYVPVGPIGDCEDCPCEDCTNEVALCDRTPAGECVPFLRKITTDCVTGVVVSIADVELDGVTLYTVTGQVMDCTDCGCQPTPMCPSLVGVTGPDQWVMPDGTESVTVTVACGPVTITDCSGASTVVNECGTGFTWAAPGTGCAPGVLCSPFTVDVPDGSAVYVNYLAPCGGDES